MRRPRLDDEKKDSFFIHAAYGSFARIARKLKARAKHLCYDHLVRKESGGIFRKLPFFLFHPIE
jgi:hypothetical protein